MEGKKKTAYWCGCGYNEGVPNKQDRHTKLTNMERGSING